MSGKASPTPDAVPAEAEAEAEVPQGATGTAEDTGSRRESTTAADDAQPAALAPKPPAAGKSPSPSCSLCSLSSHSFALFSLGFGVSQSCC